MIFLRHTGRRCLHSLLYNPIYNQLTWTRSNKNNVWRKAQHEASYTLTAAPASVTSMVIPSRLPTSSWMSVQMLRCEMDGFKHVRMLVCVWHSVQKLGASLNNCMQGSKFKGLLQARGHSCISHCKINASFELPTCTYVHATNKGQTGTPITWRNAPHN